MCSLILRVILFVRLILLKASLQLYYKFIDDSKYYDINYIVIVLTQTAYEITISKYILLSAESILANNSKNKQPDDVRLST